MKETLTANQVHAKAKVPIVWEGDIWMPDSISKRWVILLCKIFWHCSRLRIGYHLLANLSLSWLDLGAARCLQDYLQAMVWNSFNQNWSKSNAISEHCTLSNRVINGFADCFGFKKVLHNGLMKAIGKYTNACNSKSLLSLTRWRENCFNEFLANVANFEHLLLTDVRKTLVESPLGVVGGTGRGLVGKFGKEQWCVRYFHHRLWQEKDSQIAGGNIPTKHDIIQSGGAVL